MDLRFFSIITLLATTFSFGEPDSLRLSELGLPSPAAFEAVFPQLSFGSTDQWKLESEIIITNPNSEEAFIELELLRPDGTKLTPAFVQGCCQNALYPLGQAGTFVGTVQPNTVRKLSFPSGPVHPELILAWAILRSNVRITAFEKIRLIHRESSKSSEVSLVAAQVAATEATARVSNHRSEIRRGIDWALLGFSNSAPAVALANVTTRVLVLRLELAGSSEIVKLSPFSQKALALSEIFPFFAPRERGEFQTLRVLSESGAPFAFSLIHQVLYTDPSGRLAPILDSPIVLVSDGWILSRTETLNTMGVLGKFQAHPISVTLTSLGFYIQGLKEAGPKLFLLTGATAITGNIGAGVAIIYGHHSTVPIIFTKSGKVLFEKLSISLSTEPKIEDLPDQNQARITLRHTCGTDVILLDKQKEEVVSIERQWRCTF